MNSGGVGMSDGGYVSEDLKDNGVVNDGRNWSNGVLQ